MDLSHEYCTPLSCDPEDYAHVLAVYSSRGRVWWVLGAVFLIIGVTVYYVIIYINYGGVRRSADLIRRRPGANAGWLAQVFSRPKAKDF